MRSVPFILTLLIVSFWSCNVNTNNEKQTFTKPEYSLIGKWVRIGPTGPIGFNFKEN
jgi:hypothetical protein